jgi:hypothetical protein
MIIHRPSSKNSFSFRIDSLSRAEGASHIRPLVIFYSNSDANHEHCPLSESPCLPATNIIQKILNI